MPITTNEHDDEIDEDWEPGNPALKGAHPGEALAVPQPPEDKADELSHTRRVHLGFTDDKPDPGYDPADDDLEPEL